MTDVVTQVILATVDALDAADIDYAITGSFAAAQHGYVRATEDLDVQVAIDDLTALDAVGVHMGPGARRVAADTWEFRGGFLVELYPWNDQLDRAAQAARVHQLLRGHDRHVWVVSLECLLVLKVREVVRHGHGERHIGDVKALLARNNDALDVVELERLLGLDPSWRDAWERLVEPRRS